MYVAIMKTVGDLNPRPKQYANFHPDYPLDVREIHSLDSLPTGVKDVMTIAEYNGYKRGVNLSQGDVFFPMLAVNKPWWKFWGV